MAYPDFTLSSLIKQFSLSLVDNEDLFAEVAKANLRSEFELQLKSILPLALRVSTAKSRSEFLIAPILAELWLLTKQSIGVFSGVEFNVDAAQGLTGFCDFILTDSSELQFVKAPDLMLVEAKNEGTKKGFAQCIAEMIAAQSFNSKEGVPESVMYGAVTIGEKWKFLELDGKVARINSRDYYIESLDKILGILLHIARQSSSSAKWKHTV